MVETTMAVRAAGTTGRAAEAAAGAVEAVVGGAGQAVSDLVEIAGTLARNALGRAAVLAARTPGAGPVLGFVLRWLATVVSAAFGLVATAVLALADLVAGIVAGTIRLVGGGITGALARDARMARRGLGDIASSIAGSAVLLAGTALALVQAVAFMQRGERALTERERGQLRQVFRGSVALHNVRVVIGFAGLFSVNKRPFTLGNTIYLKGYDPVAELDTLVHECTHVWQFQNAGVRYAADALWAQASIPKLGAYAWEEEPKRGRRRWQDFNREAQAQLVQELWQLGRLATASRSDAGAFYTNDPVGQDACFVKDTTDHTPLAVQCAAALRAVAPWRLSARL